MREKLIELCRTACTPENCEKYGHKPCFECVAEHLIANDVVLVVRCGECKHFCEPFCIRRDDETHRERINMLTVDFCSYGERKSNG